MYSKLIYRILGFRKSQVVVLPRSVVTALGSCSPVLARSLATPSLLRISFSLRIRPPNSFSSAFPSLPYRPRLSINSFAPQPRPAVCSLLPCFPFRLLSFPPFDRRGLRLRSPRSVSCWLSIIVLCQLRS